MKKKLVIVADDFGFTPGVNKGCLETFQDGILQEMSFMVDSPGSEDAVELIKQNEIKANVGLHLTLYDFNATGKYLRTPDYVEMLAEVDADNLQSQVLLELKKFEDLFGRCPSHINGHHNVHLHEKLIDTIAEYSVKNNVWVRKSTSFTDGNDTSKDDNAKINARYLIANVRLTDYIFEQIAGSYQEVFDSILAKLKTVKDNTVTEAFFHPGYADELARKYTSLTDGRERDIELLQDKKFIEAIRAMGFEIVDFSSIPHE